MQHNPTIITLNTICDELAFIFDACPIYIHRLFEMGRIELPPVKMSKILKKQVKFSDIFDPSALAICAHAIFFVCADKEDYTGLCDMHAVFIAHIRGKYRGNADVYGEGIRLRCSKTYKMKDIIDYMSDELSDLQRDLDGDVDGDVDSEEDEDSENP